MVRRFGFINRRDVDLGQTNTADKLFCLEISAGFPQPDDLLNSDCLAYLNCDPLETTYKWVDGVCFSFLSILMRKVMIKISSFIKRNCYI